MSEPDELRMDAERYRFLRACARATWAVKKYNEKNGFWYELRHEDLDVAVDQARLQDLAEQIDAELMVKYGRLIYAAPAKDLNPTEEEWRANRYGPQCSLHPDAPHGFDRNASHNTGRYVCECEGWMPDDTTKGVECD